MAKAKYSYNEKRKEWYTLVYDGTLTSTGSKHRKRISSKKSSADLEKKVNAFKADLARNEYSESNLTFGEYSQSIDACSSVSLDDLLSRKIVLILLKCLILLIRIKHSLASVFL